MSKRRTTWLVGLLVFTVAGLLAAVHQWSIHQEREAASQLAELGASVFFDWEEEDPPQWVVSTSFRLEHATVWQRLTARVERASLTTTYVEDPLEKTFTTLRLGDRELEICSRLPYLRSLELVNTDVSDEGLASIRHLGRLEQLVLRATPVSDRALVHLEGLKNLRQIDLREANVTAKGIARLQRALPQAEIQHDHGGDGEG